MYTNIIKYNENLIVMIEEFCSNGSLLDYINKRWFKNKYWKEKKRMKKNIIEVITYLDGKKHCTLKY